MEHKKEDVLFFPRIWLYARTAADIALLLSIS